MTDDQFWGRVQWVRATGPAGRRAMRAATIDYVLVYLSRSLSMILISTAIMTFFLALGLVQAAAPESATFMQYGALGAMCLFLMGLVLWFLRIGREIILDLKTVIEKNTAVIAENSRVMSNCEIIQDQARQFQQLQQIQQAQQQTRIKNHGD